MDQIILNSQYIDRKILFDYFDNKNDESFLEHSLKL